MQNIDLRNAALGSAYYDSPRSKAKLYVFHAGTDNLSPIYRDSGLTVMQANPAVADDEGEFEILHAIEGEYRLELRTNIGQTIEVLDEIILSIENTYSPLASSWASAPKGVVVQDGLYSARHYAEKASDSLNATVISQSVSQTARTTAESAQTAAIAARAAAENARDSAVSAAQVAGASYFESIADGLAGTSEGDLFMVISSYGTTVYRKETGGEVKIGHLGEVLFDSVTDFLTSPQIYTAGTVIRIRRENICYEVGGDSVTDHAITHPNSSQKLYIHPGPTGQMNVLAWGAARDGVTDDTTLIQAAIDYCAVRREALLCPGGPYLISTLQVKCKIIGSHNDSFGFKVTFVSAVGAGDYAIVLNNTGAALEMVTVKNTGPGNGITCQLATKSTILRDVSTVTSYPPETGSGSIGVNFGSDDIPGQQAITTVSDLVNSRNYDIGFRMRYYSNSNVYRQLYALSTNNAAAESSHGFLIDGRGSIYEGCNTESRFRVGLETTRQSEENLFTSFWSEGTAGQGIKLAGKGNIMLNPYGAVGVENAGIPLMVDAYNKVIQSVGGSVSSSDFNSFSQNMLRNSGFHQGVGDLNWGSHIAPAGEKINSMNAMMIVNPATTGTVTADHPMNYLDLNDYPWLRGKIVTMACFGKAETGVNMSLRGIVRTSTGSNIQFATSIAFPEVSEGLAKISFRIPDDPADARYLVFRIYASNLPANGIGIAGKIACPMVFLGSDLNNMEAKPATDGSNTFYGSQKIYGGGHDQAHLQIGTHHLWVDASGVLRIKNGVPNSDTDGVLVAAQI